MSEKNRVENNKKKKNNKNTRFHDDQQIQHKAKIGRAHV